jgi:toxin ParE1/3/4
MKIHWSPTAIADIESIRAYIASDSPRAANSVSKRIRESILRLQDFPFSGRAGRVPETRELVVPGTAYIAAYIIDNDEILIAAVVDGRRDWPMSFETQTGNTL